MTEVEGF